MATPIGTLGTAPSLVVGGRVITDLDNLIVLGGFVNNNYATLRLPNGTAGYQITTGKTFKAVAIEITTAGALSGARSKFFLIQGDNDVGFNSLTLPTNPIYEYGDSSMSPYICTDVVPVSWQFSCDMSCAATKYLTVALVTAGLLFFVKVYGYES